MSTDQALLERARAGDTAAVEEILRRYERQIYRYGLRLCGAEDSAREVLQETLLAAFKNLRAYRGEATLSTWLYQIARNSCIKQRHLGPGEPAVHESVESRDARAVPMPSANPEDRAHARQLAELIQLAMRSLPPEACEVLVLRDVEGLSAEEAAEVLELSVPALKSRLHRARRALTAQLAAVLDPPCESEPGLGDSHPV